MKLLFLLLLALAQNAPSQAASGAIDGRLVTADGAPLSRAAVELRNDSPPAPPPPGLPSGFILAPAPLLTTTTDAGGRFVFPRVSPGRYQLVTTHPGFVHGPTAVTVASGQRVAVEVTMTGTGAISGRVYAPTGEPIGNVGVEALTIVYRNGRRALMPAQSVRTDDRGEYRLFWLAPGKYLVRATHPESETMLVGVMAGRGMRSGSGIAISGSGGPGANGNIFAIRGTGDATLFDALPPADAGSRADRYVPVYYPATLDDESAAVLEVRAAGELSGIDIPIAAVRARHVRGAVIDGTTGQVAQYAGLRELRADGMGGPGGAMGLSGNGESPIDPSGSFDVTLLPGRHTLVGTAGSGTGYLTVVVGDADLEGVRIVAMPEFDVPGRLRIDGSIAPQDVARLRIMLLRDLPVLAPQQSYSVPRADGSFVLAATAGNYRVAVAPLLTLGVWMPGPLGASAGLAGAFVQAIRLGGVDVLNDGVHLEGRPGDALEIVISTRGGTVEGSVLPAAAGVTVVMVPDVRHRFDLFRTTTSDGTGRFRFEAMPPGDYRIFAWENVDDGAWQDAEFLRAFDDRGTAVRVLAGASVTARVSVAR